MELNGVDCVCVCVCVGSVVNNNSAAAAAAHFPSVCWLFGKRLHAELHARLRLRRPLGLVSVTYSDSNIDEWFPSRVIDTCKVHYTDRSCPHLLLV